MIKPRTLRYSTDSYKSLCDNTTHNFAQDFALEIYQANSIYSFIPKNACSTMRLSIAKANGCIKSEDEYAWIHYNNDTFQASLRNLLTTDYSFVILRCPYKRLASCFLDKIVDKNVNIWGLFYESKCTIDTNNISFHDFVTMLKDEDYLYRDIHWRPQIDFLVYDEYDEYFDTDNFKPAADILNKKIGLEVLDARKYTKHGNDQYTMITEGDFSKVSNFEIAKLRNNNELPEKKLLFTPEIIDIIKEIYADDIKLYSEKFGKENLLF